MSARWELIKQVTADSYNSIIHENLSNIHPYFKKAPAGFLSPPLTACLTVIYFGCCLFIIPYLSPILSSRLTISLTYPSSIIYVRITETKRDKMSEHKGLHWELSGCVIIRAGSGSWLNHADSSLEVCVPLLRVP